MKIVRHWKTLVLSLGLFFFWGCQIDDHYNLKKGNDSTLKISDVSMQEIFNDAKHSKVRHAITAFRSKIATISNPSQRIVYDPSLGIYIDEDSGKMTTKDGYVSYTFAIVKDSEFEKIENIVFSPKTDGTYESFLVKYDITEEELKNIRNDHIRNLDAKFYSTDAMIRVCIEFTHQLTIYEDCGEVHANGYTCEPKIVTEVTEFCDNYYAGGSGGGDGGGSPTPGVPGNPGWGGGGSSGTPTSGSGGPYILTTLSTKNQTSPDPCEPLSKLRQPEEANIDVIIQDLNDRINNKQAFETAYSLKSPRQMDDNAVWQYSYDFQIGHGDADSSPAQTSGSFYCIIHMHPDNGASGAIPSFQDLELLAQLFNNAHERFREVNNISVLTVAKNPATNTIAVYAITVRNISALLNALTQEINLDKWNGFATRQDKIKAIQNDLGYRHYANKNRLERFFLDRYSNYGVSLHKLTENGWNELMAKKGTSNEVFNKPCQ